MEQSKKTLNVTGLHCNGCEQRAARVLEQLPSVQIDRIDHELDEVEVHFDTAQTTIDEICDQLEIMGYRVQP